MPLFGRFSRDDLSVYSFLLLWPSSADFPNAISIQFPYDFHMQFPKDPPNLNLRNLRRHIDFPMSVFFANSIFPQDPPNRNLRNLRRHMRFPYAMYKFDFSARSAESESAILAPAYRFTDAFSKKSCVFAFPDAVAISAREGTETPETPDLKKCLCDSGPGDRADRFTLCVSFVHIL